MESMTLRDQEKAFLSLRKAIESYAPISDETWQAFMGISKFRSLTKHSLHFCAGEIPNTYAYVYQGLVRGFVCDEKGNEYNKNFFDEGKFPRSMTALLTSTPSVLVIH